MSTSPPAGEESAFLPLQGSRKLVDMSTHDLLITDLLTRNLQNITAIYIYIYICMHIDLFVRVKRTVSSYAVIKQPALSFQAWNILSLTKGQFIHVYSRASGA